MVILLAPCHLVAEETVARPHVGGVDLGLVARVAGGEAVAVLALEIIGVDDLPRVNDSGGEKRAVLIPFGKWVESAVFVGRDIEGRRRDRSLRIRRDRACRSNRILRIRNRAVCRSRRYSRRLFFCHRWGDFRLSVRFILCIPAAGANRYHQGTKEQPAARRTVSRRISLAAIAMKRRQNDIAIENSLRSKERSDPKVTPLVTHRQFSIVLVSTEEHYSASSGLCSSQ